MNQLQTKAVGPKTVKKSIHRLKGVSCAFPVVRQCIDALGDPEVSGRDIERLLASDQGLATRVLKLANSAYFGISGSVSTIAMAVGVVGHRRLRLMLERILVADMLSMFNAAGESGRLIREFGVITAGVSHDLSAASWVGDPEEMLTVGLLHNVGDLALASLFPTEYRDVERRAGEMSRLEAEKAVFGLDGGTAGRWLLDGWLFPPIYGAANCYWRTPLDHDGGPYLKQRLCLVHAAVRIAMAFVQDRTPEEAFTSVARKVTDELDLHPEIVESLYEHVPERMQRVREAIAA